MWGGKEGRGGEGGRRGSNVELNRRCDIIYYEVELALRLKLMVITTKVLHKD